MNISDEALPDRITLYMLVDRHVFPQKLGPFAAVKVPLDAGKLLIPRITDELRQCGFYWEMYESSLASHGLRTGTDRVVGQVSPLHPVTVEKAQLEELGVSTKATAFAWSYPISNWHLVESNAYLMDRWEDSVDSGVRLQSFLSVGGFVYFDADDQIVGITTVGRPEDKSAGSVQFSEARRWEPEWTAALAQQGRFQTITMKSLRDVGAVMSLWLRPNEILETAEGNPLPRQPDVPHGGFVFLFHDDLVPTREVAVLDRYFAMLPPSEAKSTVQQSKVIHSKVVSTIAPCRQPAFRFFSLVDQQAAVASHTGEDASDDDEAIIKISKESSLRNSGKEIPMPHAQFPPPFRNPHFGPSAYPRPAGPCAYHSLRKTVPARLVPPPSSNGTFSSFLSGACFTRQSYQ
jgi:hypothetical protein